MNKKSTLLEAWKIIKSLEVIINEDCDSTLVEDLPASKVIDTAIIGYLVYKQDYERVMKEKNSLLKEYAKSQKEHKALEIIKEKLDFYFNDKAKSISIKRKKQTTVGGILLCFDIQEEYELLKEVIIHDR